MGTDLKRQGYSFWKIVEQAKTQAGNEIELRPESLEQILLQFDPVDILRFNSDYRKRLKDSYRQDLWDAATVIHGGFCSDDSFDYFCDFIISEGRDLYQAAHVNPDNLPNIVRVKYASLELYRYAMGKAYQELTGISIYSIDRG